MGVGGGGASSKPEEPSKALNPHGGRRKPAPPGYTLTHANVHPHTIKNAIFNYKGACLIGAGLLS